MSVVDDGELSLLSQARDPNASRPPRYTSRSVCMASGTAITMCDWHERYISSTRQNASTHKAVEGMQRVEWVSHISSGTTSPPNDYGIVAVIDGSKSIRIGDASETN